MLTPDHAYEVFRVSAGVVRYSQLGLRPLACVRRAHLIVCRLDKSNSKTPIEILTVLAARHLMRPSFRLQGSDLQKTFKRLAFEQLT